MKLLLIEDNQETAETIKEELSPDYIVETSLTAEDGEYQAEVNEYDLIILDLGLPDQSGMEVCRKIRQSGVLSPILILTGEASINKKVMLFELGADDYLLKPFEIDELKARIKAIIRRCSRKSSSNVLTLSNLTLDLDKKVVRRGEKVIDLRRKDFYILEYLIRNAGNVVSRGMIIDHVWDSSFESLTNIVDVHIKYLRDRVDKEFGKKLIKTVHGLGYKIEA